MPQVPTNFKYKIVGNNLITDFEESEILKDIALRIQHGRRLIIPIGLPQAGKSMFIASLIAYAFKRKSDGKDGDNSCNFSHVFPKEYSGVKQITNALDKNDTLPSTRSNEITIIDLDMKSRYRKRPIHITLIDLAGEDVERLIGKREDTEGTAAKIKKILAACVAKKAIFAIITPVESGTVLGQRSDFDTEEDSEMKSFIDDLHQNNPKLYNMTKFLFVISKWDTLPQRCDAVKYLQYHRQQLFTEVSSNAKYGLVPYSVGNVVGNTIIDIILRSPKNFWYTLYRWCTGQHVLPWWKRLFS
ncbi:MAG: hypothetical protein LBJ67_08015 [Planctomycetaceae bacterium]|jgi:hypothetical protein|nr:hypothetical protein [Planctomycetaceae bacterium]